MEQVKIELGLETTGLRPQRKHCWAKLGLPGQVKSSDNSGPASVRGFGWCESRMDRLSTRSITMSKSTAAKPKVDAKAKPISKGEQITALLKKAKGASIAELMKATGWRSHSVRGFLAGSLKRKGILVESEKVKDERRYRISAGSAG